MKIQQSNRSQAYEVYTTDMDECTFYLNWLYDRDIIRYQHTEDFDGPADICRFINISLDRYYQEDRISIRELITDMHYNYKKNIITDDKTFWFRDDKRACFWVWTHLFCTGRTRIYLNKIKSENPGSHTIRYQRIVTRMQERNNRQDRYDDFIDESREVWADILNNASFFNFLEPGDTDSVNYAWKYLCDKKYGIDQIYTPLNEEERWLSIMNYLDSVTAKENKGGLSTRLKAALDQRKHRRKKQQNSSSRRFYLKNENDSKLKFLLQQNRMTMDEYFNLLVEREYQHSGKKKPDV